MVCKNKYIIFFLLKVQCFRSFWGHQINIDLAKQNLSPLILLFFVSQKTRDKQKLPVLPFCKQNVQPHGGFVTTKRHHFYGRRSQDDWSIPLHFGTFCLQFRGYLPKYQKAILLCKMYPIIALHFATQNAYTMTGKSVKKLSKERSFFC